MTAALEAHDLHRRFGAVEAVRGLSFRIEPGELYGLVGPDGAGKTTTIRMLTGLMTADAGRAEVGGAIVGKGAATRDHVGYMPQQYSLYGDLSVNENMRFFGQLFGIPKKTLAERSARLLGITRLERFGDRRADALSGGMYKKLALACALLHTPRVLVLDEPTNGVDPVSRRELWDLLYELVADGMAVLLATPYMDEASRCHRVGLVSEGKFLAEGRPDELVRRFDPLTWLARADDRDLAEDFLHGCPGVMAISPQGRDVRVVVHREQEAAFRERVAGSAAPIALEPVAPDFEDVFLGLLQDPTVLRPVSVGPAPVGPVSVVPA